MEEPQLVNSNSSEAMKSNRTTEDKDNEENDKNQTCSTLSKPLIAGSKLSAVTNSFLKPSSFSNSSTESSSQNKVGFTLNPSKLNPFAKIPIGTEESSKEDGPSSTSEENSRENIVNGNSLKFIPLEQENKKHLNDSDNETTVSTSSSAAPVENVVSGSNNFVFGQNLKDRVVTDVESEEPLPSCNSNVSNGSSDMLFTSALKDSNIGASAESTNGTNVEKKEKTLSESAREYEEARTVKRKFEEVEIKTGEEGETNVIQISCKLFAYKSTGWQERGRGILRLNDQKSETKIQSRLVFRTSGSFRVILNTNIWPDMSIQLASEKSIRFTAFDNGDVRVFLVMASQEDIKQLYRHLEVRVKRENNNQQEENKSEYSNKKVAVDTGGN